MPLSAEELADLSLNPDHMVGTLWVYHSRNDNEARETTVPHLVEVLSVANLQATILKRDSYHLGSEPGLDVPRCWVVDSNSFLTSPSPFTYLGTVQNMKWLHEGSYVRFTAARRRALATTENETYRITRISNGFVNLQLTPSADAPYRTTVTNLLDLARNYEALPYYDQMSHWADWRAFDDNLTAVILEGMRRVFQGRAGGVVRLPAQPAPAKTEAAVEIPVTLDISRKDLLDEDPFSKPEKDPSGVNSAG